MALLRVCRLTCRLSPLDTGNPGIPELLQARPRHVSTDVTATVTLDLPRDGLRGKKYLLRAFSLVFQGSVLRFYNPRSAVIVKLPLSMNIVGYRKHRETMVYFLIT